MDPPHRARIAARLRTEAAGARVPRWELVRTIHRNAQTPTLLMAWRLALGYSQRQLAQHIQQMAARAGTPCAPAPSVPQISRWESGKDPVGRFYRPLFSAVYATVPAKLGFAEPLLGSIPAGPSGHKGEDDVDRRQFLRFAASAPALIPLAEIRANFDAPLRQVLPAADLEHWTDTASTHAAAYADTAPQQLLDAMGEDLAEISSLAHRYPHQRGIQLIAARMCGLTGALHTDLDDPDAASWLRTATGYAQLADEAPMRTWVAMAQAMDAYYAHRPGQVIRIAAKAREDIGSEGGAALVQLTGLTARAHAQLGDTDGARGALATAQEHFSGVATDDADAEFFGFPERQLTMYTSSVLSHIGDEGAADAQQTALELYNDDSLTRTVILLDRARYLLHSDAVDDAAATAAEAILDLDATERIPLLLDQAAAFAEELADHSPTTAQDYRSQIGLANN